MSIVGLGNDLVEVARMEKILAGQHAQQFVERVLTPTEQQFMQALKNPEKFLAKRWAAKEAAAKALGTGIAQGVSFQDFEISNDELGAPKLNFSGVAQQIAEQKGAKSIWLSLSDERKFALATVVLAG